MTLQVLQRGSGLDERPPTFGVVTGSDDILEAARAIAALDLMISIDSMPAHLAGALDVPTWTLLQADSDWRWMDGRTDSPWYPTMRLFRQQAGDDWSAVVTDVALELRQLAAGRDRRGEDELRQAISHRRSVARGIAALRRMGI